MKIAVLGVRGLPAGSGGIERHCEELYSRLAKSGHEVTVFAYSGFTPARGFWNGVRIKSAPTINSKTLDALVHSATGSLFALRERFDIVHYHAIGPSLFSFLPKVRREKVVVTVHALDWQQASLGKGGRAVLKAGEWSAVHFPDRTIVFSRDMQAYLLAKYGHEAVHIPNGVARATRPRSSRCIRDFGIRPGRYILFLGRLVPEKGCHDLIAAFLESGVEMPLVIAGASNDSCEYAGQLRRQAAEAGDRVIFTGNVEGELLHQLSAHAALFVLPSMLEGVPVAMLEMLALGVPVLASDIAPSREVLADGDYGAIYRAGDIRDLRDRLRESLEDLEGLKKKAAAGRKHVRAENDWDRIAVQTEKVYQEVRIG